MSKPKNNGRAFPDTKALDQPGMTLRDYFAGQALAGLLASGHFTIGLGEVDENCDEGPWLIRTNRFSDEEGKEDQVIGKEFLAPEAAWQCADEMLREREKTTR